MVTNQSLDHLFGALADPTRRVIVDRLTRGDATVGELAEPFDMSRPAISKHLKVLERAGLVHREIEGRVTRCSLEPEALRQASDWVSHYRRFWEGQLDRFSSYLDQKTGAESRNQGQEEPPPTEEPES
jgi:DNA-binding transcriptional ArsR family regulator